MSREVLVARLVDAAVEAGTLSDSLRDHAVSAGSSARMLIYYFGTREGVIAAIVEGVEARWRGALAETTREPEAPDLGVAVTRMWHSISARRQEPLVRTLVQIAGMAVAARDGLDASAASGPSLLREALDELLCHYSLPPATVRPITAALTASLWGSAELLVVGRDRAGVNEGVLRIIEALDLAEYPRG